MKKIVSIVILAVLVLSLSACGDRSGKAGTGTSGNARYGTSSNARYGTSGNAINNILSFVTSGNAN